VTLKTQASRYPDNTYIRLMKCLRISPIFDSRASIYSPKMPAPRAPAAPNNSSRPTAPVTLGAAPVGVVKTGAVTSVVREDLTVPLGAALLPVDIGPAPEPEPLLLLVWMVTSPVASSWRLARTNHVSVQSQSMTQIDLPVAGTFSNPAVRLTKTGVIVVKYSRNPARKSPVSCVPGAILLS
jgi:hypothetical protein